jgi:hypothetical protein
VCPHTYAHPSISYYIHTHRTKPTPPTTTPPHPNNQQGFRRFFGWPALGDKTDPKWVADQQGWITALFSLGCIFTVGAIIQYVYFFVRVGVKADNISQAQTTPDRTVVP